MRSATTAPVPSARGMCAMRLSSHTLQGARDATPAYCGNAASLPDAYRASVLSRAIAAPHAPPDLYNLLCLTPPPASGGGGQRQAQHNGAPPERAAASVPNELITAINMYCRFCNEVSIRTEDLPSSFQKLILVFQKNINVRAAYEALFPSSFAPAAFIDWERVALLSKDRAYLDTTSWIRVLASYTLIEVTETDLRTLLQKQPVLHHYHDCMLEAKLVAPGAPDRAAHLIYLYLLVNVQRLQSLHAVEQFYSINHNADRRTEALLFFSLLANRQFDRDLQTQTLVAVLSRCVRARSDWIRQELELLQLREKELEGLFRQKTIRAMSGRPKLRSRLRQITAASGSLFTMDQLAQWNASIRFPNVFSMKQRKRLYFLMAQVHLDPASCIRLVLKDHDLALSVLRYPVKQPELEVMHECITGSRITSDPFPEMHQFRASCFDGFAYEHKVRLRLNDLLHLFISAYQNQSIWKDLWKLVFPVLSIQIIRDVENFVSRVPFPAHAVLGTMFDLGDEARPQHHGQPPPPPPPPPFLLHAPTPLPPPSASQTRCSSPALSTTSAFSAIASPTLFPASPAPLHHPAAGPQAHGVLGELHHTQDVVWNAEAPLDHGVVERVGQPAPLQHEGAPEPPGLELGVPKMGRDPALRDPAQPHHVEDEDARTAVLEEKLPPKDAGGGALLGDDAQLRVADVAHVA